MTSNLRFLSLGLLSQFLQGKGTVDKDEIPSWRIIQNTGGAKTEETTDDSGIALLLFFIGVLVLGCCLFCIIRKVSMRQSPRNIVEEQILNKILKESELL